jgi:hypothetical protein
MNPVVDQSFFDFFSKKLSTPLILIKTLSKIELRSTCKVDFF